MNAGRDDPHIEKFLSEYDDGNYDWGDDPAFFAAKHKLMDVRKATWGVCRPDVRNSLEVGDVVVFFCTRPDREQTHWAYRFIGFGTVEERIRHKDVWTHQQYAGYRSFYNLLIDAHGRQSEIFRPIHNNWEKRLESPYILFDSAASFFNLDSPHLVAEAFAGEKREIWKQDRRSQRVKNLLFIERNIDRGLRTSATGYMHAKLNLLRDGNKLRPGRPMPELLKALAGLVY